MSDNDNMHGNERFGDAYFAAERVSSGAEDINDATVANAYATLALAYEQRTANLIAVADRVGTRALLRLSEDGYEELGSQLRTRLGLDRP